MVSRFCVVAILLLTCVRYQTIVMETKFPSLRANLLSMWQSSPLSGSPCKSKPIDVQSWPVKTKTLTLNHWWIGAKHIRRHFFCYVLTRREGWSYLSKIVCQHGNVRQFQCRYQVTINNHLKSSKGRTIIFLEGGLKIFLCKLFFLPM